MNSCVASRKKTDFKPSSTKTNTASDFRAALAEQITRTHRNEAPSELNINIKNGVATLSGNSSSTASANMVEYLVSRIGEVDHVINLLNKDSVSSTA